MIRVPQSGDLAEDIRRIIHSINHSEVILAFSACGTEVTDGGGSGGGGGAPTSSTYLTLSVDPTLTNERVLTPGDGLTAVDGGANGAYTLAVSDMYHPFLLMGG